MSNVNFTVYSATGRIIKNVSCSHLSVVDNVDDGCYYLLGDIPGSLFYVADGVAVLRPTNPTTISTNTVPADGDTAIILQTVAGTLTVGSECYEVEDGLIELTFGTPDEYVVRLDAFPYLPFEAVIHAY